MELEADVTAPPVEAYPRPRRQHVLSPNRNDQRILDRNGSIFPMSTVPHPGPVDRPRTRWYPTTLLPTYALGVAAMGDISAARPAHHPPERRK